MNDLFLEVKSKKDQLKEYILSRNFTKTHEVIEWGVKNFHCRALRDSQELCALGAFRRMNEDEMKFYFPGSKEWIFVANDFK